ncbi:MAG TPA: creatininase family protein [Candidatus Hydrogenedentes bacterium]|nr:creatininase family protein [Candidatus Hydrogenedentota bacterium]HOL76168.1 creatininase family protein [Candidatus Hydrogenedentota bacterium]HPO84783.1 creatininase family protein [Candidatus Hydrogenedentota bacterium]
MKRYEILFERALPRDLEAAIADKPVAYVPMGTLEFHGWHLPLGFDALKAHTICVLACKKTQGFAGGHRDYPGSIISDEMYVAGNLQIILQRLYAMGFRVVVVLTGHYPQEQVNLVHAVASEAEKKFSQFRVIALAEPEAFREWRGDHAAKWETSLAHAIMPELVDYDAMEKHEDPLYGICGEDPRRTASQKLGQEMLEAIVVHLANKVEHALSH